MDATATSVTGILVTGKSLERRPLAERAVLSWQRQKYPGPRTLLIINDSPSWSLIDPRSPVDGVSEIRLYGPNSLGSLRNTGISMSTSKYLVQWDDDDYSAEDRLLWQVTNTVDGSASIFMREIHYDMLNGDAFISHSRESRVKGFAGTMLWPAACSARFPDAARSEDVEFLLALRKEIPLRVLNNAPHLYVRCFHGMNTWDRRHIMRRKRGTSQLSRRDMVYMQNLTAEWGTPLAEASNEV